MADIPIPPIPPRRAPLIDIMRELEVRPRALQSQEFDPVAAMAAERRSQSRQPLPLPPIPPAVAPPRTAGDSAEAGPPRDLSSVSPTIRDRLPENNPYVSAAIDIAEKYNLPRDVFLSLVHQESRFDPKAKSPRGAFGLTQLMPGTARDLGVDPRDPMANLDAGARYLRQQIDRFGSLPLALAAYNSGPGRVIKSGNQIPNIRETQNYVSDILRNAGMEGTVTDQRYGFAEGGLADLEQKYADGGRVRRPAAAPVASPFDADYIERLAAQAVGAGDPVTEVRSAEGRGFAPMPRSFGEAGQRMSAVIRGDVEPTPEEERQMNVVRGFTEGPASIRAYHGSPHAFERFDISKIGTGEGNQAYGHGLYFAENENIAKHYRDTLSDFIFGDWGKYQNPPQNSMAARLSKMFDDNGLNWERGTRDISDIAKKFAQEKINHNDGTVHYLFPDKSRFIVTDGGWDVAAPPISSGSMYEVRLRAAPEDLVNWNAPLVQQPARAIPFLEDFLRAPRTGSARALDREIKPIGEAVNLRTPAVAAELREAGIPGLRYLDANSRSGRKNTHNYVMFGDDLIDITRRYAEGGLAALDQKYADGGTVRAPKETYISGQEHKLAYITDREAALLKARGGSGRMTEHGVRAYNEGPGGDPSDNANSNSEAATQDAAGGNAGQGAGPTGAGAGATGEQGPGPTGAAPTGEGQSEVNTPGQAPGISTQPTTNINIGLEDQANAAAALGALANAPIGFEAIGVRDAIDMFDQGRISFADLVGYGLNNMLGPPGTQIGVNVNPRDQTQTPAYDISIPGLAMGALGMISGIPGLGMLGGRAGTALGNALGIPSVTVEYSPGQFDAPTTATSVGEYPQYGQPEYGTPGLSNIATSMAPATAAPLVDWNQIQREASAMNMSVSDYLAMKWRSPATMARGGMASLEDMEAKYADGGDVRAPAGEVAEYNPEEIDRIARQIHLRFPEDDMPRTTYDEVESPNDLITRARFLMRGQNVGQQTVAGIDREGDSAKTSTSLINLPFEDDRYNLGQRVLNNNLEIVLDPETKARLGMGLQAIEMNAPQGGATGYGPQISAGYGPLSLQAGYKRMTQNKPGSKSQDSYTYGGNLEIPLDEQGAAARLGANIMSGRRGTMGAGSAGTQITGSFERPLLGGRLALELSADPSLRHKEILLGYRRAF